MHPGTGRLNGLGGDANTVSSMLALGLPLALVLALRAHARTRASWLAIAALALLAGSIVASGSRGALLAGAAGCALTVALVARDWAARARGLGVLALAVALAAAAMAQPIGSTVTHGPAPTSRFGSVHTGPGGRYTNAELTRRLEDDVGASNPGEPLVDPHRTFLNSSGRGEAWVGALKQAAQRPTVGFGFGTEPRVFVDRYVAFQGGYVENAYIGLVLQLGAAGLVLFALAIVVVGRRIAARLPAAAGDDRRLAAGFAGVVAGGLALAATQSFVYSAGNVATVPFWVATLAAVATLRERRPGR
jgi:O-antigen ligase